MASLVYLTCVIALYFMCALQVSLCHKPGTYSLLNTQIHWTGQFC